jgi:hypothetical protein
VLAVQAAESKAGMTTTESDDIFLAELHASSIAEAKMKAKDAQAKDRRWLLFIGCQRSI